MNAVVSSWPASDAIDTTLDEIEATGARLVRPNPDGHWTSQVELEEESRTATGLYPHLEQLRDCDVVLGFLGRSHLGDVVCVSPLPRLLALERGCRVFVVRHRATHKVFENNPYLAGR